MPGRSGLLPLLTDPAVHFLGHPHDLAGHLHCRFPRFRLGVRRRVRPPSSCLAHRTLSAGRARSSPPPVPTSQPPTGERIEIAPYPAPTCERRCADAGWIVCLHEKPSAYLLRSGCLDQIVAETVKKIGREGQQHYLRDESARGGSRLGSRILRGAGTHVAQELPGLAIVLDDAGIGLRGGSGHRGGSFR